MDNKFKYHQSAFFFLARLKTPLTYLMGILLIWLLNVNHFIYADQNSVGVLSEFMVEDVSETPIPSNTNPAGPDEKSPNAPFSFSEEYIHESQLVFYNYLIDEIYLHKIQATELIELVHHELWSPPPEIA